MANIILEQNTGVDQTNMDGGAFNNFTAGNRNGVLYGVLGECGVYAAASNVLGVTTGVLLIHGIRVKITEDIMFTLSSTPSSPVRYQLIAEVQVQQDTKQVTFNMYYRLPATLTQNDLYIDGGGTFQIEIAQFTHTASGITDIDRTVQTIIGPKGITFVPSVSPEGVLTWQNDGDLENPEPVNIRGPQGEPGPAGPQGEQGETGATGSQGEKGEKGDKGDPGEKGEPGADGTPAGFGTPTAEIDNSVGTPSVEVTAMGPNTAKIFKFKFSKLKGEQGIKGDKGETGEQGPRGIKGDPGDNGKNFNLRGTWEQYTSYDYYDLVEYNGSSYVWTDWSAPIGLDDIPGKDNAWKLLASKGDTGATGPAGKGLQIKKTYATTLDMRNDAPHPSNVELWDIVAVRENGAIYQYYKSNLDMSPSFHFAFAMNTASVGIAKYYSSVEEMQADLQNVEEGKTVAIDTTLDLYYRAETEFVHVGTFKGEQGEQGPKGDKGEDGKDGDPGLTEEQKTALTFLAQNLQIVDGKVRFSVEIEVPSFNIVTEE